MSQYTEQNKFALYRQLTFITDIVAFIQGNILEIPDVCPPHSGLAAFFFKVICATKPKLWEYEKIGKILKELGVQEGVDLLDEPTRRLEKLFLNRLTVK